MMDEGRTSTAHKPTVQQTVAENAVEKRNDKVFSFSRERVRWRARTLQQPLPVFAIFLRATEPPPTAV